MNFLKKIFQWKASFFEKKGKFRLFFLFLLVFFIAGFLRVYKLGQQSFIADEYLGINASYGYLQTNQWKFWDFNQAKLTDEEYTRANVYYWQVAKVLGFFGVSESIARMVSVLWGMIGLITLFLVVFYFTKKRTLAFLAAFFLAVSISALTFDRKLRMYSMFSPLFFLFSISVFQFFESEVKFGKNFKIVAFLKEKFGVNVVYLPALLFFGYLAFQTHLLVVNILPVGLGYILMMALWQYFKNKKIDRYFYFLVAGGVLSLILLQNVQIKAALDFFSLVFHTSYFSKITLDYSHFILAFSLIGLGGYYLIKKNGKFGLWVVINFLTILFLAVFFWGRNAGHQYIYFITPFKIILMATGVYYVSQIFAQKFLPQKKWSFWLSVGYLLLVVPNWYFFFSSESFYLDSKKWSYPNYREAFKYYLKNRNDNSILVMRPMMKYYIKDSKSELLEYSDSNKLTLKAIKEAQSAYDEVWIIFTKDLFISGEVEKYLNKNFESIKTQYTNNVVNILVWKKAVGQ
mgnify:CR=1 FL=1